MASDKGLVLNPLIVALDLDDPVHALALAKKLRGVAGAFKVGPRLTLRSGPDWLSSLRELAPVFLDHKYFDIPSTMESAVQAAFDLGVTLVTVHASAGPETLRRLAALELRLRSERPFCILAVTVLTSVAGDGGKEEQVLKLASQVDEAGLGGLVCSPLEVGEVMRKHPRLFRVTPGIRSPGAPPDDQSRTLSAREAIAAGASALVVGRPILQAGDPYRAACEILKEMEPS